MYPPEFNTLGLIFIFLLQEKRVFFTWTSIWVSVNHFFTSSTLFVNVIFKKICCHMYIQKRNLNSPIKTLGCSGSHHFQNWRRVWKEIDRNGRQYKRRSFHFIHFLTLRFSELHSSNRIHKFCVSNNEWSYVEGSLMWMQLLPNSWQIGIDLRIRLVAAACELSFHLLPRPWRTKGRVKALSGPAKAGALTEVLIRSWKEAYHRQGWRVGWLAQGHRLLEFNPSSPSGQAAQWGLETRGASFRPSAPHCVTPG